MIFPLPGPLPTPLWRLLPALLLFSLPAGCGNADSAPVEAASGASLAAITADPGASREQLGRAIDALFDEEIVGETRAVIVLHNGSIAAERYGENYSAETPFLGWSLSKTVTGVMIGQLVADGRLELDSSPPIPRWQRSGDPRGEITVRQLLQMRGGLRHEEKAEPSYASSTAQMLFLDGRDDMAAWAEAQPLEHEPGAVFEYSTPASVILSDVLARVLAPEGGAQDRQKAVASFLHDRLTQPLNMPSMRAEFDAAGTMIGGAMVWANARDWSRLGEFLRRGGTLDGAQIVPRGWVDFMRRPSPRAPDYGATLWLNRDSGGERQNLFDGRGPQDLFAALGHQGQFLLVSPSQRLTVVRMGKSDHSQQPALIAAMEKVVGLYPENAAR